MKIEKKILLITITTLIFGLVYLVADSKLFYYGKSILNITRNSLPLDLQPVYLGSRVSYPIIGFTISDKYGIIRIGKDVSINIDSYTIKIKEVIKYGFDDKVLIANILTDNDEIHNIRLSYISENKIIYKFITSQEINDIENLKWIVLNEESTLKSLISNSVILLIVFNCMVFLTSHIIKNRK